MLPYIEVSGSHREIGRAIGEHLRKQIASALGVHFKRLQGRRKRPSEAGIAKMTKTVHKMFPDFVEELKGIAEGSGETLGRIMLFSFEEELAPGEHCTSVGIKGKDTLFFGHNEDWDLDLPMYIIKAQPRKKPAFLSVGQAGQFPGTIGFNAKGLAFAGNSVETKVNFSGLPKVYCLRKFLECSTIDEARNFIAKQPRTIGNNSLFVSGKEKRIATLEWSPRNVVLEETGDGIAHTNHFIFAKTKPEQSYPTSRGSDRRYYFAQGQLFSMHEPKLSDVKKLLQTHFDATSGLCQHGSYPTIVSAVVDTHAQKMFVAAGTPCNHPYRSFSL